MASPNSTFVKQVHCLDAGEKHSPSYQPHLRSLAQGSQWTHDMGSSGHGRLGPVCEPASLSGTSSHSRNSISHLILGTEPLTYRNRRCCLYISCSQGKTCEQTGILGFASVHKTLQGKTSAHRPLRGKNPQHTHPLRPSCGTTSTICIQIVSVLW